MPNNYYENALEQYHTDALGMGFEGIAMALANMLKTERSSDYKKTESQPTIGQVNQTKQSKPKVTKPFTG